MYQFSATTYIVLENNGWTKERKVDTTKYATFFEKHKQPVSEIVLEFLSSFGDLEIRMPLKKKPIYDYWFKFDVYQSADNILTERLHFYEKDWFRDRLCTIGVKVSSEILLMTPNGALFSVFDSWVFKFGDSWQEAIENICTQNTPKQIFRSK